MRPADEPSVIAAAADLVTSLGDLGDRISHGVDSPAGKPSVFIGQVHAGEIYNQYPRECMLEGTRRWLPGTDPRAVEAEFRSLVAGVARDDGVTAEIDWRHIRGAFRIDEADPFVAAFQECHAAVAGARLPIGPKPFVDDGNSFSSLAGIPAITHGPRAGGQHTVDEWVDIDDLVRMATLYAMTAITYLDG
jgi:acetylornithine deacetylase/succinyl-diaminopimelate desuccinylase-like protein